jgi:hypothetical protein
VEHNKELYPWLSAAVVAWGLLDCFFGYRIFRVMLTVAGGVVGAWLGHAAVGAFALGSSWDLPGMVVGGLLGIGLTFLLYLAAVFVTGFFFGLGLGVLLLSHFHPMVALLSGCVLGLIGGFLAVKLQQVLITLSTALLGSFRSIVALSYFTGKMDWMYYARQPAQVPALLENNGWMFPSILVLATVGALCQFGFGSGAGKSSPKAKKPAEKKAPAKDD